MNITLVKSVALSLVLGQLFQIIISMSPYKDDVFRTIVGQMCLGVVIACHMIEKLRQPEKNK